MTDTQQQEAPREPVPAHLIPLDKMYATLRRLANAARLTVRHAERNHADLHKSLDTLSDAAQAAEDLFFPPPLPDSPEGALTKFARAVRIGEQVWVRGGGWLAVIDREEGTALSLVRWKLIDPVLIGAHGGVEHAFWRDFPRDDVVAVRPAAVPE